MSSSIGSVISGRDFRQASLKRAAISRARSRRVGPSPSRQPITYDERKANTGGSLARAAMTTASHTLLALSRENNEQARWDPRDRPPPLRPAGGSLVEKAKTRPAGEGWESVGPNKPPPLPEGCNKSKRQLLPAPPAGAKMAAREHSRGTSSQSAEATPLPRDVPMATAAEERKGGRERASGLVPRDLSS